MKAVAELCMEELVGLTGNEEEGCSRQREQQVQRPGGQRGLAAERKPGDSKENGQEAGGRGPGALQGNLELIRSAVGSHRWAFKGTGAGLCF